MAKIVNTSSIQRSLLIVLIILFSCYLTNAYTTTIRSQGSITQPEIQIQTGVKIFTQVLHSSSWQDVSAGDLGRFDRSMHLIVLLVLFKIRMIVL